MAHFSVTPETAIYVFPPYSVSQENDKNKTNRTSLHTSSAGGTCSIFGELRFHMLCGAAIKKKKKKPKQTKKIRQAFGMPLLGGSLSPIYVIPLFLYLFV